MPAHTDTEEVLLRKKRVLEMTGLSQTVCTFASRAGSFPGRSRWAAEEALHFFALKSSPISLLAALSAMRRSPADSPARFFFSSQTSGALHFEQARVCLRKSKGYKLCRE